MSIDTLHQMPGAERPVFKHSIFTVGIATIDGKDTVLIHATVGEHLFEFRLTPEDARQIGEWLTERADLVA